MKNICLILFLSCASGGFSQPLVYFDFLSHNEETGIWNGPAYYSNNRIKLIALATYFESKGITWNMQSDQTYLNNVILQDSAYFASTGNKNILRWMYEDKGVEMDPHGHETQYIYPDLVKLMDSIGLPESKVMGGTLYGEENGINLWTNLIDGQYGLIFPEKFWQPDYMMGGGTPNHVADLNYYGFWNPKSETEYLTHEPNNHLRHIGVGCEIKVQDTTTVEEIVSALRDVVNKVQNGSYPSDGFYLQTIFFEQGSLNAMSFYSKMLQIADSAAAIVAEGNAQWLTLKQAYTKWETVNQAQVFQWECGQIATVEENEIAFLRVYPNPASGKITLENNANSTELSIYSMQGKLLKSQLLSQGREELDLSAYAPGLYFFRFRDEQGKFSEIKVTVE